MVEREYGDLEISHPGAPARANAVADVSNPHDYHVLVHGEVGNTGDPVPRRFLEVLSPDPNHRAVWTKGSGRLDLAHFTTRSPIPRTR